MASTHILLVERDESLAEVLAEVLVEHGLSVKVTAELPTAPPPARLILADFADRAAEEVRQLIEQVTPVPVGLLNSGVPGVPRKGAAFVLDKPIDVDELVAAVAPALALPDTAATQRELVERYFQALGRGAHEELAALLHPEVVYNLPNNAPHGGVIVGREAFLQYTATVFAEYPDVTFEVERHFPLPAARVARYAGSWTTESGRVVLDGHVVFGFEGDAIARVGVHLDSQRLSVLRASSSDSRETS